MGIEGYAAVTWGILGLWGLGLLGAACVCAWRERLDEEASIAFGRAIGHGIIIAAFWPLALFVGAIYALQRKPWRRSCADPA